MKTRWDKEVFVEMCQKGKWENGLFDRASIKRISDKYEYSPPLFYRHFDFAVKTGIIEVVGDKLYQLSAIVPKKETPKIADDSSDFAELVLNYLNSKLGSKFKANKQVLGHISARRKEGYRYEDFVTVIDKKIKQWKGTKMEKYIRPLTLFSTKFDSYLNEQQEGNRAEKLEGYSFEKYFN